MCMLPKPNIYLEHKNEKCMGSHWESNPRPPTLAVNDALTTELRLPCNNPALVLELDKQAKSTNVSIH